MDGRTEDGNGVEEMEMSGDGCSKAEAEADNEAEDRGEDLWRFLADEVEGEPSFQSTVSLPGASIKQIQLLRRREAIGSTKSVLTQKRKEMKGMRLETNSRPTYLKELRTDKCMYWMIHHQHLIEVSSERMTFWKA